MNGVDPVLLGELELAEYNLLLPVLEGCAHLEALVLNLHHTLEGRDVGGNGDHAALGQRLVAHGELAC